MRVLQVGFGAIGSQVFLDYQYGLRDHTYMVTDLVKPSPAGHEYDGGRVDIAILMVDTRPSPTGDGFDYSDLIGAILEYETRAEFFVIRSTVGPYLFGHPVYLRLAHRIGFSPEFNGATKWSNRQDNPLGFEMFSVNVPVWFALAQAQGARLIFGDPREVSLAKMAENAFLALKVTFFHEMILAANEMGLDGEQVRYLLTQDPRIGDANSFMEEPGWTSHCYDKDVPAYAQMIDSEVIRAAMEVNERHLLPSRKPPINPQN